MCNIYIIAILCKIILIHDILNVIMIIWNTDEEIIWQLGMMKMVIISLNYFLNTCDIWIKRWLTNRGEQDWIFLSFCLFVLSCGEVLSTRSH